MNKCYYSIFPHKLNVIDWKILTKEDLHFLSHRFRNRKIFFKNVIARVVLRKFSFFCANLMNINFIHDDVILYTPKGKPYFSQNPLWFSVSYGHEESVIVISSYPIGVDISLRKSTNNSKIIRFQKIINSLSEGIEALYESDPLLTWVEFESLIKLIEGSVAKNYTYLHLIAQIERKNSQKIINLNKKICIKAIQNKSNYVAISSYNNFLQETLIDYKEVI